MLVGVALPQYAIDASGGGSPWEVSVRIARDAESLGLDAVWLSDHPFAVGPDGVASGAIEPLVSLAALARGTRRIRLGTLVLAATMRAPALVAHAMRSIGLAAPGRIVAGVGAGWYAAEHRAFGIRLPGYRDRVAALEAALRTLEGAGVSRLCGGAGGAAIDAAARGAEAWNVAWDVSPEVFSRLSERADEACRRAGRDPRTLARSVGVTVLVAEGERGLDAAVERLRGRAPFLAGVERSAIAERIVCGTPDAVAARLAAYGADEVVAALLLRDDPEMLALFAERVAPSLR